MLSRDTINVEVPYGEGSITASLPKCNVGEIVRPARVEACDEQLALSKAIDHPIGASSLQSFLSGPGKTLVIVNDAARPTPTARVLPTVLKAAGTEELFFIVATGAHSEPSAEDLAWIFGPSLKYIATRVLIHYATKESDSQYLGTTSRGTRVVLDRAVLEADRLLIVSSVEPHYFAGYTGGRKSIMPGVASFESIEQNHALALEEGVLPLALKGNPVHEDMLEAVRMLGEKPIFSINLILDGNARVVTATAGDLEASFEAATRLCDEVYVAPVQGRYDVVVSVARPPLDQDLYQLQKALEHALMAVKKGGVIILVSKCAKGLGESSYTRPILLWEEPDRVLENVLKDRRFGCHKAGRLAKAARFCRIMAVTDLDPADLRPLFMEPFSFLSPAIDAALHHTGPDSQILFLMNGSLTVPRVE